MEKYLLPGELADLFGINKQTILYYEKQGLITPDHIDSNGYRYYSRKQYLTLEIITNLRKLKLPLQEIRIYLKDKNPDHLIQLTHDIISQNEKQILHLKTLNNMLEYMQNSIRETGSLALNRCILCKEPQQKIFLSPSLKNISSRKKRLQLFGYYNNNSFSDTFKCISTGWVFTPMDFFNSIHGNYSYCFFSSPLPHHPHNLTLPEGNYLFYTFSGTYRGQRQAINKKIRSFLTENNLIPSGNIYLYALKNHWLTDDYNQYISQIKFLVSDIAGKASSTT